MLRRNSCRLPQEGWQACPLPRLSSRRICFYRTSVPLSLFRASSRPWAGPAGPKASSPTGPPPAEWCRERGPSARAAFSAEVSSPLPNPTPCAGGGQPPGRRAAHGQGPQGEHGVSPEGPTCPPPLVEARLTLCPAHACRCLRRGYTQQWVPSCWGGLSPSSSQRSEATWGWMPGETSSPEASPRAGRSPAC